MNVGCFKIVLLSTVLLVSLSASVYGNVYNLYYGQALSISAETPGVILQQGTVGTSTIYENNTSAKVSVIASAVESVDSYEKEIVGYVFETAATLLSGSQGDDVGVWYNLPWIFPFYGVNKTQIYLCSNGFGVFDTATNDYSNSVEELGERKKTAPFWDDLRTDVNSYDGIYAENKTGPDRVVISWNTTRYGASSDVARFQMILFRNGTIQFNWNDFVNLANFSPTCGLGNGEGRYLDVTSELAANKSIRFIPTTEMSDVGYAKHGVCYVNETLTVTTPLTGSVGDDVGVWYTLPWIFSYYGENKTSIYLCSNGFATFDTAYNGYANSPSAMGTRKMIAPFWDDLRTDVNSYDGIYAENKTNPDRAVFYWRTTRYGDSSDIANFQLVLFRNGTIQSNWVNFTNLADFSPTSGIGKGDGTIIDVTSEITESKSIRFISNTFDYVLEVANQVSDTWKIRFRAYDQTNMGRLFNCTIFFHNGGGVSRQIYIYNGTYSQQFGNWYNLTGLSTVYIAMRVSTTNTGASYVYIYLEILIPGTSTYNLFIITFEIT
ncbi:MAG: hypothetical protein QMD13_00785 [Candidatus Bathyarchaeia archaeon]|nr:hypothetical protein [Candidatus Bathyarchaeia archaeon]